MVNDRIFDYAFAAVLICCAIFCLVVIIFVVRLILRRTAKQPESKHGSSSPIPAERTDSLFSPVQIEIIQLSRDLRRFLKDSEPRPTLAVEPADNLFSWLKRLAAVPEEDAKWSRKFMYAYRENFAGRVKTLMYSIGKTTGMVVDELEPYSTDVTPGTDFQQLLDILMDFFDKIENPDRLKEPVESLSPQPEEQCEPSSSILQSEAFRLSDDLREFLKKLGPRPQARPHSEFEHSVDGTAAIIMDEWSTKYETQPKWDSDIQSEYTSVFSPQVKWIAERFRRKGLSNPILVEFADSIKNEEDVTAVHVAVRALAHELDSLKKAEATP